MSARDAESGSSTYKGGSGSAGGVGNGGIGGGTGGGGNYGMAGSFGGAGLNGGYAAARNGMATGTVWHGNTAFGAPGQMAQGYAMRDPVSLRAAGMGPTMGYYGNFRGLSGNPMFAGTPYQGATGFGLGAGQVFNHLNSAAQAYQAMNRPQMRPGVNPVSDTPPPVQQAPLPPVQPPIPSVPPPAVSIPPNALMYPFQGQNFNNVWSGYNGPGSTYYQNGSTIYKNGMGDYGGFGNRSTAYKQ